MNNEDMKLQINPEFENMIPGLTDDELSQLEENILAEGSIVNPIVVWNGVIVDGHNRYKIAQKHPHIQERIRQDTRGMRGKARRADKNDESGNRRDEKASEKRITKRADEINRQPSKFASQ